MFDHLEDYWWLYLIVLPFVLFMGIVIHVTIEDNARSNACVASGLMPIEAYGGNVYCVDPRALTKPLKDNQ